MAILVEDNYHAGHSEELERFSSEVDTVSREEHASKQINRAIHSAGL
jgi:hypothetical protein